MRRVKSSFWLFVFEKNQLLFHKKMDARAIIDFSLILGFENVAYCKAELGELRRWEALDGYCWNLRQSLETK